MSHNSHEEIICPNCNHPASGNYCAQCGQATHLHNDSFRGLVSHFISHYFHFENKFWDTFRQLIFRPGSLDIAYYNKQRKRFTDPISLYIFVSVIFFIVASYTIRFRQVTTAGSDNMFTIEHEWTLGFHDRLHTAHEGEWVVNHNCDSLREVVEDLRKIDENRKGYFSRPENKFEFSYGYFFITFYNYFIFPYAYRHHMYDIDAPVTEIYNEFFHLLPKIFFLLMPLLALLLYMFFFRSKKYRFVNYAVLSLHTHIFMFISALCLLLVVGSVTDASNRIWVALFLLILPLTHFLFSCRNFFRRNWIYTITIGTLTWVIYMVSVVLIAAAILLLMIDRS